MALLLARGPIERVERQVADRRLALGGGGLPGAAADPADARWWSAIVLLVSVIGWPLFLLYPFLALGLLLAAFLGYVGVALRLGRWVEGRGGRPSSTPTSRCSAAWC